MKKQGQKSKVTAAKPMKTVGRLLGYFRYNKAMLLGGILLVAFSSLAQVGANGMLSPLIDSIATHRDWNAFLRSLVVMVGLIVLLVVGQYFGSRMLAQLAQKTVYIIRSEMIEKVLSLPVSYFDNHTHGETMSSFTNDVDMLNQALEHSVGQILISIVTFAGTISMMILLSPLLTGVVVLSLGGMMLIMQFIARMSGKYFRRRQQMTAQLNGYVEEMISAQKVIKVFNYEERAKNSFDEQAEELRCISTRASTFGVMAMPVMGNLSFVMYSLVAMSGAFLAMGGIITIGNIAAFLQYTRVISRPIVQVSNLLNLLFAAIAGAERIFHILDMEPEEMDAGDVQLEKNGEGRRELCWRVPQKDGTIKNVSVQGDIRFTEVDFGYTKDKLVLQDISLYAKPGQKIAFVGSTGAGKTTITNLINRFYEIEDGQITVDGIDIQRIKKRDLRSIMSVVLQDVRLFQGTIAENIRYGRLDATDEEVVYAAKSANAHHFISKMEQGYETVLDADGSGLSQGERQLISIARAAIADPIILIMDEATSSVDTRTEQLIEKGMDRLMEGRTTFVIAHRLSTIRRSNAILVLEQGRIVERGDHDDLMAMKGRYYDLNVGTAELD